MKNIRNHFSASLSVFLLCLCILSVRHAFAQTTKGMKVNPVDTSSATGKTYALIVGISKYHNPAIQPLLFADKDAIAFRDYLIASGVDSNNITLLINEKATQGG